MRQKFVKAFAAVVLTMFILAIVGLAAHAQTLPTGTAITLNAGTHGYVTINGQDYMRGSLGTHYVYPASGDSTLAIYYMRNGSLFITPSVDTLYIYGDSTNKKARNMQTLKTWMRNNLEYVGN